MSKIDVEKNKLYLVTGASGFLGKPLIKTILEKGGHVRGFSRNEGNLIELQQQFPTIEIYSGDVSDSCEVRQAMKDVDGVFHLAASKHVGLAEKLVRENVKSNTIGSLNIFEQSLKQDLDFIISISTDKAAQVNGVYGATKLLMERLSMQYEKMNPNCIYRVVRYGNVLYSTGSVLCKWKDFIEQGKEVIVTEPEATRFFWTVDQAIGHIFECLSKAVNSKPYVPWMKSMSVGDLLQAMIEKYAKGKSIRIITIGLQPGENLHEKITDNGLYSNEIESFTIEEIKQMI